MKVSLAIEWVGGWVEGVSTNHVLCLFRTPPQFRAEP